jgi:glycosyltransferase involved in cell wall biosynthesis
MRVAIGVHGRFSAFNIATGLIELGHDIRLFTNYPSSAVARFGVPADLTEGFTTHGVATRIAGRIFRGRRPDAVEAALHRTFGKWLAARTRDLTFDILYCWSGIAEEAFAITPSRKVLNRSSVHIQRQYDLLHEESQRVGTSIDMPGAWRIEREKREYAAADVIIVPSISARQSFEGTPVSAHVRVAPLTARAAQWRPAQGVVEQRVRRIESGARLRVLFVGAVSYRKGMFDIARVVESMSNSVDFRFTGEVMRECAGLAGRLEGRAQFEGHVPESALPASYAWADVLLCPSIEDGFGVVLAHAQVAGIPFIASTNTGGPDLIALGGKGWIVPIRAPDAIEERLAWCDAHREELAAVVRDLWAHPVERSWQDVARDVAACFGNETAAT